MNVENKYNLLLSNQRECYCDLIECSIILGLEETGAISQVRDRLWAGITVTCKLQKKTLTVKRC